MKNYLLFLLAVAFRVVALLLVVFRAAVLLLVAMSNHLFYFYKKYKSKDYLNLSFPFPKIYKYRIEDLLGYRFHRSVMDAIKRYGTYIDEVTQEDTQTLEYAVQVDKMIKEIERRRAA